MNRRVIYVASGENYVREAAGSIESLRRHNPTLEVTLVTDIPVRARAIIPNESRRLDIVAHPAPSYTVWDKIDGFIGNTAEESLFLDTDTYICGDLSEVFDLLKSFDVAAAHAIKRPGYSGPLLRNVPDTFPEFNTGVVAFCRGPETKKVFEHWKEIGKELSQLGAIDQAAFRLALYQSRLRFATLPPEYNFRFRFPAFASGSVKILHGRDWELDRTERAINKTFEMRVYVPGVGVIPRQRRLIPKLHAYVVRRPRLERASRIAWHLLGLSRVYRTRFFQRRLSHTEYRGRPLR